MRWKRLIRCAAGFRCADVVVTDLDTMPDGAIAVIQYTCGVCGTHYEWDSRSRKRRTIHHITSKGPSVSLEPGETRTFVAQGKANLN